MSERREARGRVVGANEGLVQVRDADGRMHQASAGDARLGDWVRICDGRAVQVARPVGYGRGTGRTRSTAAHHQRLGQRSQALRATRAFFHARGFIEIEPTLRVEVPGMELHIDALRSEDRYLITSPEYQMKRLVAEGHERIYSLTRCFRGGERGRQHSTEFSMLEWYRSFAELDEIRRDTEELVEHVARDVAGEPVVLAGGRRIEVTPPFDVVPMRELFETALGVELEGDEEASELRAKLVAAGVDTGTAEHWDDLFYTAFLDRVDPVIERWDRPLFVTDWPIQLGALAKVKDGDPRWVERFELYVGGVELANAFGELIDPVEQRARLSDEQVERSQRGKPVYPLDERFLSALEHGLPPTAGIALGFDRLVMLATGASDIWEVQAFGDGEV